MSKPSRRVAVLPYGRFRLGAKVETFEYRIGSSFSTHPFLVRAKYLNIFLGRRYLSITLSKTSPSVL